MRIYLGACYYHCTSLVIKANPYRRVRVNKGLKCYGRGYCCFWEWSSNEELSLIFDISVESTLPGPSLNRSPGPEPNAHFLDRTERDERLRAATPQPARTHELGDFAYAARGYPLEPPPVKR